MSRARPLLLALLMLTAAPAALAQKQDPRAIREATVDHLSAFLSVYNFMSTQVKLTPVNMDRIASDVRLTLEERIARAMATVYTDTPPESPQFHNIVKAALALDAAISKKYATDAAFLENMLGAAIEGYATYRAAGDREELLLNEKTTPQIAARVTAMSKVFASHTADSVVQSRAQLRQALNALIDRRPELIYPVLAYQPPRDVMASRTRVVDLIRAAR